MSDEGNSAPHEMKQRREVGCEEGGGAEANVGAAGAVQKVLQRWRRDGYGSEAPPFAVGSVRRAALGPEVGLEHLEPHMRHRTA